MNYYAPKQEEILEVSEHCDQLEFDNCSHFSHKKHSLTVDSPRRHFLIACHALKSSMLEYSWTFGRNELETMISLLDGDMQHDKFIMVHIYLDFFYESLKKGCFGDPRQAREGLTAPTYQIVSVGPALTWSDPCVWRLDEKKEAFLYNKPLAAAELASERLLEISPKYSGIFAPRLQRFINIISQAPHRESARVRAAKAIIAKNIIIKAGNIIIDSKSIRAPSFLSEKVSYFFYENWEVVRLIAAFHGESFEGWLTQLRSIKHDSSHQPGT